MFYSIRMLSQLAESLRLCKSDTNVLVPQFRVCFNELLHKFFALVIVHHHDRHSLRPQQFLLTHKIDVFPNDNIADAI
jgi:hypothetical protein